MLLFAAAVACPSFAKACVPFEPPSRTYEQRLAEQIDLRERASRIELVVMDEARFRDGARQKIWRSVITSDGLRSHEVYRQYEQSMCDLGPAPEVGQLAFLFLLDRDRGGRRVWYWETVSVQAVVDPAIGPMFRRAADRLRSASRRLAR
ncbi:MAG: hypothetical protein ACK4VY_07390 [Brevundimonas sp.]